MAEFHVNFKDLTETLEFSRPLENCTNATKVLILGLLTLLIYKAHKMDIKLKLLWFSFIKRKRNKDTDCHQKYLGRSAGTHKIVNLYRENEKKRKSIANKFIIFAFIIDNFDFSATWLSPEFYCWNIA